MKKLLTVAAALLLAPAVWAQEGGKIETSGRISSGLQQFDNDTDSSKFNEYRDIRNNFYLNELKLDVLDTRNGRFLELAGLNVSRDDQEIRLRLGQHGSWGIDVEWSEVPHLFSNKARSPYIAKGAGMFEVPATIPITFKKLNTVAADAPGVVASDLLTAGYAQAFVLPADLGTQRDRGTVAFKYSALDAVKLRLGYSNEKKAGSRVTYGPIGDRPPRSLNIQLAEPVDQRVQDLSVEAEYLGKSHQLQLGYRVSDFGNRIDTLTWQNVFATPAPGAAFDAWDRAVSAYGRRPLSPDNCYHNATARFGADLPLDSHLSLTAAYGRLDQDQTLLPYSYHSGSLANPVLPRDQAEARIDTTHFQVDYTVNPASRLNLRAYFRYYDLDNKTPESDWQYVTSDTSNLNGTVSFKNKRVSLAYAYDTRNAGLESSWRLGFWRGSLGLGYEREEIGRAYREADTKEDRLRGFLRLRPADWLSIRGRYLHGDREGSGYDGFVTRLSYWYAPAEAGTDNDNPAFTFSNHPDMRRYDVSDRKRDQLDLTASLSSKSPFSVSASFRHRKDDYDSGVRPSQPLLGTGLAEQGATSPGDQLGLLDDERFRYALDAFYAPSERLTLNAFASREKAAARQRSLEFNENNKQNPGAIATAELGPWSRAGSQWTADFDDRTSTLGLGAAYVLVPGKVSLAANYTLSRAKVDIEYTGFGVVNWNGTPFPENHQFAFGTPPTLRQDTDVASLGLEYRLTGDLALGFGYVFDRYRIRDWQQETNTPWYESVGTEFLLRDTSRSHQWGNRLFNMGSYLAPDYKAHLGYVTVTYRF